MREGHRALARVSSTNSKTGFLIIGMVEQPGSRIHPRDCPPQERLGLGRANAGPPGEASRLTEVLLKTGGEEAKQSPRNRMQPWNT